MSISKCYVNSRDYNWCLVMVFDSFTSEMIDLPYLNTTSKPKLETCISYTQEKYFTIW
jgi:hypothetical protein